MRCFAGASGYVIGVSALPSSAEKSALGRAQAAGPALSEFAAKPARAVVHDPAEAGALDLLAEVPEEELRERSLFSSRPEPRAFSAEHAAFVTALRDAGIDVVHLRGLVHGTDIFTTVRRNPNQVYTRDSVITLPWLPGWYIGGAMRIPIRRPEVAVMAAALRALGLRELFTAPPDCFLEGGDVIPFVADGRRTLIVGFGPRTARRSLDLLWERLAPWALDELIGVRLAEWRMNLDGALVPVAHDTVVAHPRSIETAFVRDRTGQRAVDVLGLLHGLGMAVIEVTQDEAMAMQACNILCLGARRVICYDLCGRVLDALLERNIDARPIPGSELIKGTGGPRCMTRPVYA